LKAAVAGNEANPSKLQSGTFLYERQSNCVCHRLVAGSWLRQAISELALSECHGFAVTQHSESEVLERNFDSHGVRAAGGGFELARPGPTSNCDPL
jgi:hypothetical protein